MGSLTKAGSEVEGTHKKRISFFLDDKTIHAQHDEVWRIITDEKSGRFSNRLFQPKKWSMDKRST